MTSLFPSVQARRGDENLERARSLREQFEEVIPSDAMVSLQNRITMYVSFTLHITFRVPFSRA